MNGKNDEPRVVSNVTTLNPDTGEPWTTDTVDAAQVRVRTAVHVHAVAAQEMLQQRVDRSLAALRAAETQLEASRDAEALRRGVIQVLQHAAAHVVPTFDPPPVVTADAVTDCRAMAAWILQYADLAADIGERRRALRQTFGSAIQKRWFNQREKQAE